MYRLGPLAASNVVDSQSPKAVHMFLQFIGKRTCRDLGRWRCLARYVPPVAAEGDQILLVDVKFKKR